MEDIKFKVFEKDEYTIVHFELDKPLSPEILQKMTPPKVDGKKGVVLSGRGPIWLYSFLTHHYHPTKFIAIYDPRIGGAIVVESHTHDRRIGDILDVELG